MVFKAIKTLSGTKGVGLDFWHPLELLLLHKEALDELTGILNEVEMTLTWPRQTYLNKMVFLDKAGGGDRTIGLGNLIFRIWQKVRSPAIKSWEAQWSTTWDGAAVGQGAEKAATRREAKAEVAVLNGGVSAKILWDLATFFRCHLRTQTSPKGV